MPPTTNRKALIMAAKAPYPGRTKTRLSPPLSKGGAAGLYECFLKDICERLSLIGGVDRFIAYYPESSRNYFFSLSINGFSVFPQKGRGLGERMADGFETLFSKGYEAISLIGSDSPTLPYNFIHRSFEALDRPDIDLTLGPSRDGGYYLIGLKEPHIELFEDIKWSTSSVLDHTIKRAEEIGLRFFLLPEWYDIDTTEDLNALKGELLANTADIAPRTKDFLLTNFS